MGRKKNGIEKIKKRIRDRLRKKDTYAIRVATTSLDFAKVLKAALDIYKSEKNPLKKAVLSNLMSETYFLTAELAKAEKSARKVSEDMALPAPVRAHALAILAQVYVDKGEYARGEDLCKEALALTDSGDDVLLAQVLNVIGSLHYLQGRYSLALEYSKLRKKVAERMGDSNILIGSINNMALSYINLGRDEEAIQNLEYAKSLAEKSDATLALAHVRSVLSSLYMDGGDVERGLKEAEKALLVAKKSGYTRMYTSCYVYISHAWFVKDDYKRTVEFAEKAIESAEESKVKESLAWAHANLGKILAAKKNNEAAKHFQKSIELYSSFKQPEDAGELGFVYFEYGRYLAKANDPSGYEYLSKAKSVLGKLPPTRKAKNALSELRVLEKGLHDTALTAADEKVRSLEWELDSLKRILEFSREINSEIELESMLGAIVDSALRISGAERGFIALLEKKDIRFAAVKNFGGELERNPDYSDIRGIVEKAAKRPDSPENYVSAGEENAPGDIKSLYLFPLEMEGKVLGLLYLDSRFAPITMDAAERKVLEAVLDQTTLIIERVRSFERLDEEIKRKNEELEATKSDLERKQKELEVRYGGENIIGTGPSMQKVFAMLDKIRDTNLPVCIAGESGTGKELVAKAVHYTSERRKKHFTAINCAAIPESLLESELFGYEKGAFTGADKPKAGLFEIADGGTLFLDEIADMSSGMQQKILRVLQEKEVRRIGAGKAKEIDIRLISASNKDLKKLAEDGDFREDLFYRVSVISISIPPLRERKEDIPILVEHFWKLHSGEDFEAPSADRREFYTMLEKYEWPGNVRELENEISRLASLGKGALDLHYVSKHIGEDQLPAGTGALSLPREGQSLADYMNEIERGIIIKALKESGGAKSGAARLLGIPRSTLCSKIEKFGIVLEVNAK
ncbi:MAG: sigma 54-interacting transcriptional regulator [Planctomycetota bacterium]|jgi:transcriptional regulator with GAF, ATPase, and Fis domain